MSDTFLTQLEQRTQQVKITLANLEAERTRIEAQIGQLQPLLPHYDALVHAERALADANIDLDRADVSAAAAPANNWEEQHKPSWERSPETSSWNS